MTVHDQIKLGWKVRDTITGVEGTAIARTEWLHGCVRVTVQPAGIKDGVPFETFTTDEPQLEVVEAETVPAGHPAPEPRHGPRDDPSRHPDLR